jgi:hypothetical protein
MVDSFQRPIHRVWCIGLRSVLVGVLYLEVQLATKSLVGLIDFSGIVGGIRRAEEALVVTSSAGESDEVTPGERDEGAGDKINGVDELDGHGGCSFQRRLIVLIRHRVIHTVKAYNPC